MTEFPALDRSTRWTAIRKLALRAKSYLLIAIKPDDLLRPRGPDHVFAPIAEILQREEQVIAALLADLAPGIARAKDKLGPLATNGFFEGGDAQSAYAIVQHLKPARLIEIGSGSSTRIMRQAAMDDARPLHITCIDPMPRREIADVADRVIRKSVLEAGVEFADGLEAGDILFIDGSHYAFNGTDVPFLFLEVLPRLKPGVMVHIHDIMLPYEYGDTFTRRNYNEQYVLAALLLGDSNWRPILPVHWLAKQGRIDGGLSFWMRRI